MQRISFLMLTMFLLNSCAEEVKNYDYYKFNKQITPSGKYVIYDYARYGEMSFSSDILKTELFKLDEPFAEGGGKAINGEISEWISNDTLLIYNFKSDLNQPKDTLPIKTDFKKLGDFVVKTVYYKSNSGGRAIYDFDSVRTTGDSIFIRVLSATNEKKFLRFPLGGTTIKTRQDSIVQIEIDNRLNKSMNFVYKNSDGTFSKGLPEISTTWYDLKPIKKISATELQKKKIFWGK